MAARKSTTPTTPTPAMPATSYRAATGSRRGQYAAVASVTHGDGSQATTRDALDWVAWLAAGHESKGLAAGNVTPPIAQRAATWLAAHEVPAPQVGQRVTVAYVAQVLAAVEAAGVPADALAAMRAHYGVA